MSGAPLDGGHAERAVGVVSEVEWRSLVGTVSKTKRRMPFAARRAAVAEGVHEIVHGERVAGHVAEFASGTLGAEATRDASSASTVTIDAMDSGTAGQGQQFQRNLR